MQDGYLIESKKLDADRANVLLAALQTATVPASQVEPFLGAVLSLRRIAEGQDHVGKGKVDEVS